MTTARTERLAALRQALTQRILVIDGAMGTMIQGYHLAESDYRGERLKDWPSDLKGNNDILVLTQPKIVAEIHRAYLDAGADIIETNTFTANHSSQADYRAEELVRDINLAAAHIARRAADEYTAQTGKVVFVAGALGPTSPGWTWQGGTGNDGSTPWLRPVC